MKTAVSVPDEVFKSAEVLAKRLKLNRSQLFSRALSEFLARHSPDEVTAALNRVCGDLGAGKTDSFVTSAARQTLKKTEW